MAKQKHGHFALRGGNRRGEWATACGRSVREQSLVSIRYAEWITCPECRKWALEARKREKGGDAA